VDVGATVRKARRRAGLSQRALAARTGVAQPTIARIERGQDDPRLQTVERLLNACDESIEALPRAGIGVDRSEIRELLALSPRQRLMSLVEESAGSEQLALGRQVR